MRLSIWCILLTHGCWNNVSFKWMLVTYYKLYHDETTLFIYHQGFSCHDGFSTYLVWHSNWKWWNLRRYHWISSYCKHNRAKNEWMNEWRKINGLHKPAVIFKTQLAGQHFSWYKSVKNQWNHLSEANLDETNILSQFSFSSPSHSESISKHNIKYNFIVYFIFIMLQ